MHCITPTCDGDGGETSRSRDTPQPWRHRLTDTHGEPTRPLCGHSPPTPHAAQLHTTGTHTPPACSCPAPRRTILRPEMRDATAVRSLHAHASDTTTSHTLATARHTPRHTHSHSHRPTNHAPMRAAGLATRTPQTRPHAASHTHDTRLGARACLCALSPPCPTAAHHPRGWGQTKVGTSSGPRSREYTPWPCPDGHCV